jgi:hypothetical protein
VEIESMNDSKPVGQATYVLTGLMCVVGPTYVLIHAMAEAAYTLLAIRYRHHHHHHHHPPPPHHHHHHIIIIAHVRGGPHLRAHPRNCRSRLHTPRH